MPLYDYKCSKCEHIFEVFHGMSEEPDLECPECKNKKAEKIISTSLVLDGRPAWDRHEDIKRYINKMKPKYIRDDKTGIRKRYPKDGV